VVPIRSRLGLRLGYNVGFLKFTSAQTGDPKRAGLHYRFESALHEPARRCRVDPQAPTSRSGELRELEWLPPPSSDRYFWCQCCPGNGGSRHGSTGRIFYQWVLGSSPNVTILPELAVGPPRTFGPQRVRFPSGLRAFPREALLPALAPRRGVWLATEQGMSCVGWTARSPVGWRMLLTEVQAAPWPGSEGALWMLTEMPAARAE
jgi:hypothetical protein